MWQDRSWPTKRVGACRSLNKLAASLLFSRVHFELCGRGCKSLYSIPQEPTLAPLVKTALPRRVRGYQKCSSFDTWTKSIHQPGAPDDGLGRLVKRPIIITKNLERSSCRTPSRLRCQQNRKRRSTKFTMRTVSSSKKEILDITNT